MTQGESSRLAFHHFLIRLFALLTVFFASLFLAGEWFSRGAIVADSPQWFAISLTFGVRFAFGLTILAALLTLIAWHQRATFLRK